MKPLDATAFLARNPPHAPTPADRLPARLHALAPYRCGISLYPTSDPLRAACNARTQPQKGCACATPK